MDEPLPSRHRTTRAGGLTSPDPVTAPPRPKATRQTPAKIPRICGQVAEKVSGQKTMPAVNLKISSSAPVSGKRSLEFRAVD